MSVVVAGPLGVDVEYPEGPKVPEGDLQVRRRQELHIALRHWLSGRPDAGEAWTSSDINVYYEEGNPRVVVSPDVAVSFGVDVAALAGVGSYRVWEAGAPPVWVLEIASPKTVKVDVRDKPAKYAALGVGEYWRFDPTGGELLDPPLQGERWAGRWVPIEVAAGAGGALRGHSAALGLDLCWEPPRLRLFDPAAGAWLLDPDDLLEAQQAAEDQAAAEATARRAAEDQAAAEATARRAAENRAAAEATARRAAEDQAAAAEDRAAAAEAELAALRLRLGRVEPPGDAGRRTAPGLEDSP